MQRRETVVTPAHAGLRLDRFLADVYPDLSRSLAQRLIANGAVWVDGQAVKAASRVTVGQVVSVQVPRPEPIGVVPEPLPLQVIYDDPDLVVIDKPAGLVVHPAAGHPRGTLVNALLARYPNLAIGTSLRPGIVHRLDKDTSGLMVVAKNDLAQASLSCQIKERQVLKEYLALVHGHVRATRGTIDAPIGRDPRDRKRMAVVASGRMARTHFSLKERLAEYDLLDVQLETGRTHQIRVHLASIGHPVAGDQVYGRPDREIGLERQFLHAFKLGFRLPRTDEYVEFTSPLPADLEATLERLRQSR
ncbi:MAG: RluA family pseudouridine synthase [Chloroflexota bacterium]